MCVEEARTTWPDGFEPVEFVVFFFFTRGGKKLWVGICLFIILESVSGGKIDSGFLGQKGGPDSGDSGSVVEADFWKKRCGALLALR